MEEEFIIAIVAIGSIFIVLPAMIFHYITLWRKQKTLMPDDCLLYTSDAADD